MNALTDRNMSPIRSAAMRVDGKGRSRALGPAALLAAALLAVSGAAHAQLQPPPVPAGNPLTPSKANLGKVLFWDEQISSTRTVACGTCHFPSTGGEDPRSGVDPLAVHPGPDGTFDTSDDILGSPGVPLNFADGLYDWSTHFGLVAQVTGRRTMSMINAGYSPELFWDGRAPSEFVDPVTMTVILPSGGGLESQAVGPPVNDVEMAHVSRAFTEVLDRIEASDPLALAAEVPVELAEWIDGRGYAELFEEAFGSPGVTAPRLAMAIASYERTLFTDESPFDHFLQTNEGLTPEELAGRDVFTATCDNCHQAAIMSDHMFHYTGVRPKSDDPGRMEVTGDPGDEGKMRTPSLRNLELRAPYMHNGGFATIEEVIDFYDQGGFFPNDEISPLGLTAQEKADLAAFLTRPLTDPRVEASLPPFDRPTLYTESGRAPEIMGSGLPGTGGLEPVAVAIEPPVLGNPSFTVGVWNALGGADALLVIDDQDPGLAVPVAGDFAFESIVLGGAGAGLGFGSVSLPIADDPALNGDVWFGRWYVMDTGGGEAAAVSPLFRFSTYSGWPESHVFADGFETGDFSLWSSAVP